MKVKLLLIAATLLFASIEVNAGEWIADSETRCKVWNDNPQPNETISWSGDCADGYAYGSGMIIWYKNGNKTTQYTGEMRRGKHAGKGTVIWSNGDRYEGDFVENRRTGKGTFIWSNGDRYEGDFKDNKVTGKGTFIWSNGDKYSGSFQNGQPVDTIKSAVGNTTK